VTGHPDVPVPLRIVVADDQASVRQGLVVLLGLAPEIEVVAAAANGEDALRLVAGKSPDAILLDLHMPVLDGIETTRRLTRQHPGVAVVILTTYVDDASVVAALEAGASSYITKDADCADIVQALRSAATGLSVIDPAVRAALLDAARSRLEKLPGRKLPEKLPGGLTQREAEILSMIARGMKNSDIAAELVISAQTIKSHINRIFAKTGSANRSDAIRYARDHQIG
jgi:DNA-binding NarL/FixJ family response regulator